MELTWISIILLLVIFYLVMSEKASPSKSKEKAKSIEIDIDVKTKRATEDLTAFTDRAMAEVNAVMARVDLLQEKIRDTNSLVTGGPDGKNS